MANHPRSLINAKIESFPSLPSVVVRIMEITSDPESSIDNLLEVIRYDQSLVATVLKMSNSPFFGQVRQVSSIKQAISVLGMNEIQNIAVAKAIFNSFKTVDDNSGSFRLREFWMHAFTCGLSAKLLSAYTDEPGEDFFIAGLIHDIGKLVIILTLPLEYPKIVDSGTHSPFGVFELEQTLLGISHDDIGKSLLLRWMFPENLVLATGYHHKPGEAEGSMLYPGIIHFSDIIAHINESPLDTELEPELKQELFSPEKTALARSVNIEWNERMLIKHLIELESFKMQSQEAFELLLS